jgi:hypothetical protein
MAVVRSDRIGVPTGLNERRVLAWLWSCADDALAGPLGGDAARAERVVLAWTSLLGDIVEEDRADHVGGTIQVRPVVAAR